MGSFQRLSRSSSTIFGVGVIGIVGVWAVLDYKAQTRFEGTENYAVQFPTSFPGWSALPTTPESLFVFQNRKNGVLMRGSVSQVIAEVNPTPELTTDGIAQFYIDRTHENQQDWTASRGHDIVGKNVRFSLIERKHKDHAVLTAFTVKGNTTLMISASTQVGSTKTVDAARADLVAYVKHVGLKQEDMGGGRKAEIEREIDANPVSMR